MISRKPGSFEAAITKIMGNLSPEVAAAAVERSEGLLRRWSHPDDEALPNVAQAAQLDCAYVEMGLGQAPILKAYMERVTHAAAPAHSPGCPLDRLATALREAGEAADVWRAMGHENLSVNDAAEIEKEICEAIEAFENMRRDLQARVTSLKVVKA